MDISESQAAEIGELDLSAQYPLFEQSMMTKTGE
jgi:hypothetical protein